MSALPDESWRTRVTRFKGDLEIVESITTRALTPAQLGKLVRALQFASRKHSFQRRKDPSESPYINHPIAVVDHLVNVGNVFDCETLIAALLHDTIEDTDTTQEELNVTFGVEIGKLVGEVTDNKTLQADVRKQLQIEHAPFLSFEAKLIKLSDLSCNLADVIDSPPPWSDQRRYDYLLWTEQVVAGCRGTNEPLEGFYDRLNKKGKRILRRG